MPRSVVVVLIATALSVVLAAPTFGDCVGGGCLPGGKPSKKQCLSEFLVSPALPPFKHPPSTITCRDGDSCDLDGDATNHSCTFGLAVCLNNHDPGLVKCVPSDVATVELLKPRTDSVHNTPDDTANATALLNTVAGIDGSGAILGICINQPVSAFCTTNTDCDSPGKHDGRCYQFVRFTPAMGTADRCSLPAHVIVPLTLTKSGTFKSVSTPIRLRTSTSDHTTNTDSVHLRCIPAS